MLTLNRPSLLHPSVGRDSAQCCRNFPHCDPNCKFSWQSLWSSASFSSGGMWKHNRRCILLRERSNLIMHFVHDECDSHRNYMHRRDTLFWVMHEPWVARRTWSCQVHWSLFASFLHPFDVPQVICTPTRVTDTSRPGDLNFNPLVSSIEKIKQ